MSKKVSTNLTKLLEAMRAACETKDKDHHRQFFHGPTNEELDAEHEQEFRLFMEEVDMAKRLSLIEFLTELANPDCQLEPWDDALSCMSDELYRLYQTWCNLSDKQMLTEQLFFHGLYLFGFVSKDCFIGIEMTYGIEIDLSTSEVRLNLKPNPHAEI
ncbi:MAG: hypothetical protein ACPG5R_04260 [Cognaticolwellia aestuarii]